MSVAFPVTGLGQSIMVQSDLLSKIITQPKRNYEPKFCLIIISFYFFFLVIILEKVLSIFLFSFNHTK